MTIIETLLSGLFLALTEPQVNELIHIFKEMMEATRAGISALWVALGPALVAYLAYRQSVNRKAAVADKAEVKAAVDANTEISVKAFDAANNHNEKIAAAVELSREVIAAVKPTTPAVQVVHVDNDDKSPIPTTTNPPTP